MSTMPRITQGTATRMTFKTVLLFLPFIWVSLTASVPTKHIRGTYNGTFSGTTLGSFGCTDIECNRQQICILQEGCCYGYQVKSYLIVIHHPPGQMGDFVDELDTLLSSIPEHGCPLLIHLHIHKQSKLTGLLAPQKLF